MLWKESLNSDCQQFHQYQQNEQSHFTFSHWILNVYENIFVPKLFLNDKLSEAGQLRFFNVMPPVNGEMLCLHIFKYLPVTKPTKRTQVTRKKMRRYRSMCDCPQELSYISSYTTQEEHAWWGQKQLDQTFLTCYCAPQLPLVSGYTLFWLIFWYWRRIQVV